MLPWLSKENKAKLSENYDDILMFLEDLSAAIDHAKIAQDDIENYLSLQLNRKLYLVSLAAALFLPLNLITSLLGINVAGIPYHDHPHAFFVVVGILGVITVLQVLLFKKIKWM
ncbi:MAG: CorA family divalent cation transporter [Planctomycetota bacterium]|nr:CorA family divalent cation transporter [Planctomycetota bacterium]